MLEAKEIKDVEEDPCPGHVQQKSRAAPEQLFRGGVDGIALPAKG